MDIEKFFEDVGGDYDDVLTRLPGEEMIRKFILKFPGDPTYAALEKAIEENDWEAAFMAAHTLKGTAANLGLDFLANAASELTEKLRGRDALSEAKYFDAVKNAYKLTVGKIELLK